MTIQAAFSHTVRTLEPLYPDREAVNIAHIVMEHVTGLGKLDRVIHKDKSLTPAQENGLQQALEALLQQQPVQYITGKSWFHGMELMVNRQVLIPRPETEELVDWVVTDVRQSGHTAPKILDIGTGSGAIPVAIKKELPAATVWAIDVSAGALETAAANATQQHTAIHFEKMDVLDSEATGQLPVFDIIVSNPPYIRQSEQAGMQQQVLAYEPGLALFVPDNDALLFYRRIAQLALEKLAPGGRLYVEINEALGKETAELLQQQGFRDVILRQDLFGKDRMIRAML